MKFSFNNPFTAPDIQDILRDRKISLRNMSIVFGAGIVLASTLIGGYHIGQWFIGKAIGPDTSSQVEMSETIVAPTVESRLSELGGGDEENTYNVLEVSRRAEELQGGETKTQTASTSAAMTEKRNDRLRELGG